jgi:head-tail adaptor
MQSGDLNRQITIERKQVVQEQQYGTEEITWVPLVAEAGSPTVAVRFNANVWDVPPSRSEAVRNGLEIARNQTKFTIRYRAGIDSAMRIVLHGASDRIYQIVGGPAEVGRKKWLEMVGEEYSS